METKAEEAQASEACATETQGSEEGTLTLYVKEYKRKHPGPNMLRVDPIDRYAKQRSQKWDGPPTCNLGPRKF